MSSQSTASYLFIASILGSVIIKGFFDALKFTTKLKSMRDEHGKKKEAEETKTEKRNDEIFPPLPEEITQTLSTTRMCFLATHDDGEPHLSTMRFTYFQKDEVIILTTRRKTKKYSQIMKNSKVALLVHDFSHTDGHDNHVDHVGNNGTNGIQKFSITLNGQVYDTEGSKDEETYRQHHLSNNKGYEQFIVGKDIAVLAVRIEKARICDINDKVKHWNVENGYVASQ